LELIFFFQAEDGIRDLIVTGVQTCALPIWRRSESFRNLSGHSRESTCQTTRSYMRVQRPVSSVQRLQTGCPVCSNARCATRRKPRAFQVAEALSCRRCPREVSERHG